MALNMNALIDRIEHALDKASILMASAGVIIFTTIVTYVALGRYIFGKTPYWSEEVPRIILVWAIFIGIVSVTIRRSHLNAGLLPLLVKHDGLRAFFVKLERLLTSIFFGVLAYTGYQLTEAGHYSLLTATQIPNSFVYIALPIGCGLAMIANLLPFLRETTP